VSAVVVDASVVLAALLPDEGDDPVGPMTRLMSSGEAVVPAVWPLEVLNAIVVGARRRRWSVEDAERLIEQVGRMRVEVEPTLPAGRYETVAGLATEHALSVYDACYLDLAMDRSLRLATRDEKLAAAASAVGVTIDEPGVDG